MLPLGAWFVFLAIATPRVSRPDATEERERASPRSLNGHLFVPSRLLASPFSTTHLGSTAMYALAEATASRYDLRGEVVGERDYSMAAFGNQIDYQLRLADFFALRVSGSAMVFSGIDGPSAVAVGATFRTSFGAGLTAGLELGDVVRLAVLFDAGYQPAFDLTIGAGILRAIRTGSFDSGEVFVLGKTVQLRPGISVAWAPIPLVGITGEVRYSHTEVEQTSSENATGDAVDMAALVDVDLGTVWPVPIAIAGLYRLQEPTSGDSIRIEDAGGAIFYTGRPHLAAGLAITQQWFDVRPRVDTSATFFDLTVRYYW
jgi:hypothetical protein